MHKMCSDEKKCAVMKGCFCSDELRRNKETRGDGVESFKKSSKKTTILFSVIKKRSSGFLGDETKI